MLWLLLDLLAILDCLVNLGSLSTGVGEEILYL